MKSRSGFIFIIFTALFLNNYIVSYSQVQAKIDSVKSIIVTENDVKIEVDNLNVISDLFTQINSDSAYFYAEKALELAEDIDYKWGAAESYFMLSYYLDRMGETEKAISKLEKACDLYTELGDSAYLVGCYNNLGVFYSYGTDQKKSLEYFIKALNLAKELNETYSLSEAYSNIGSYYEYLREYNDALWYYEMALQLDIENKNFENISLSYLYIGNLNLKLQRFDEALINLKKAEDLETEVTDPYRQAEICLNFASYYVETNNPDSVIICLNKAREINDSINYQTLDADILYIEGDLLLMQKKYTESIRIYNKVEALYEEMQIKDGYYDLYKNMADAYSELGIYEKAYKMLNLAYEMDELLKPGEIAATLGEFEHAKTVKEEQARFKLEQELANQKQANELIQVKSRLNIAILLIVLMAAFSGLILYLYMLRRKYNKKLEKNFNTIESQKKQLENNLKTLEERESKLQELNATKDKFFSIIAHDLKSPFSALIGFSDFIMNNPEIKNTKDFEDLISGIYQTASSGYSLLDNLLEWARTQTGNIEHDPQRLILNEVFEQNVSMFYEIAKSKDITINVEDTAGQQVYADKNALNCILRNLLSNAIKFSYKGGLINISVNANDDYCILKIKDYGTGMNNDTQKDLFKIQNSVKNNGTADEKGTGLGLILCKEFAERNSGKIWVESEQGKGSTFYCTLPVKK